MRNSELILKTLNDCLAQPLGIPLHLLGGAALDLVYGIERFSEDVDCICTMTEALTVDSPNFQASLARANEMLEPYGFYLTHIFDESGLVHLPDWTSRLVTPPQDAPRFNNFSYDAVSAEDIILSKITRLDAKDQMDVRALMDCRGITFDSIDALLPQVIVPPTWQEAWENGLMKWRALDR